jgi:hypothetical protein
LKKIKAICIDNDLEEVSISGDGFKILHVYIFEKSQVTWLGYPTKYEGEVCWNAFGWTIPQSLFNKKFRTL